MSLLKINDSVIRAETIMTDRILLKSDLEKEKLRNAIDKLHCFAFPKMPENERKIFVRDYFISGCTNSKRQALFIRNESGTLIASNICNCVKLDYKGKTLNGVYLISRAVFPKYQGSGIGKTIGVKLLKDLQPDILFTTSTQSSALHSLVGLVQKRLITGYEVYPRIEHKEEHEFLKTIPFNDLNFIIQAFRQTYLGVVDGDLNMVEEAIKNFTIFMARKNFHGERFDFNPWEKNGQEDKLAKALGVTAKDGVLVVFIKQRHKTESIK